jgi:putative oxidoreductase
LYADIKKEGGKDKNYGQQIIIFHLAKLAVTLFLKNKDMNTSTQSSYGILVGRLAFGFAMIKVHGWGKLMRLFSGEEIQFMDFMGLGPTISLGLATFAEVICALLIMVGYYTRWAAMPLIFTMGVVVLVVDFGEPFREFEKAFLFLAYFISLLLTGPGKFSLDQRLRKTTSF